MVCVCGGGVSVCEHVRGVCVIVPIKLQITIKKKEIYQESRNAYCVFNNTIIITIIRGNFNRPQKVTKQEKAKKQNSLFGLGEQKLYFQNEINGSVYVTLICSVL